MGIVLHARDPGLELDSIPDVAGVVVDIDREEINCRRDSILFENVIDVVRSQHMMADLKSASSSCSLKDTPRSLNLILCSIDPDAAPALLQYKPRVVLYAVLSADLNEEPIGKPDAMKDFRYGAIFANSTIDLPEVRRQRTRIIISILPQRDVESTSVTAFMRTLCSKGSANQTADLQVTCCSLTKPPDDAPARF